MGRGAVERSVVDRALDGETGARWFFRDHLEPLCDSFDPQSARRCDELMAAVVGEIVRRDRELGDELRRWFVPPAVARPGVIPDVCVVPSRVTIGADIAVTSVVVRTVRAAWPECRVAILGVPDRIGPLFANEADVEVWPVPYPRDGSVRDRLLAWRDAAEATAWALRRHRRPLVLDPDSRLTQLGLLPLGGRAAVNLRFPSRSFATTDRRCLSELAAAWTESVVGCPSGIRAVPRVSVAPADVVWAQQIVGAARHARPLPVVVVSLGVGGNERKSAGLDDEIALVRRLAARATVLLDSGVTTAERERATTVAVRSSPGAQERVTLLGGLSVPRVSAVLAESDVFVGYDSAFQHIARAVGTPAVSVFVTPPSPTFVDRWCAPGATPVVLASASRLARACGDQADAVLSRADRLRVDGAPSG